MKRSSLIRTRTRTRTRTQSIGKSRLETPTGKGKARGIIDYKRKLLMMRTEVKKIQGMVEGNFDWTPPSVSEDTLYGLKVHIWHLRRKKEAILELVSQVVSEDKETGKLKNGILGSMEEDDKSQTMK